jgi:hypothetical protein
VASYFFYGWWDWRFLSLLVLSTALDYGAGHRFMGCLMARFLEPRLLAFLPPRNEEYFGPPANGRTLLGFETKIYGADMGAVQTN